MLLLQLLVALFLPWLAGAVWLRVGWRKPPAGAWPLVLGYGYLLGLLATTLLMRLWNALGLKLAFWPLAGLLFLLALAGIWLSRDIPWRGWQGSGGGAAKAPAPWHTIFIGLLLAVLVIRYAGLGLEILWRPLYPWDAWTIWAPRAKVWFALKELVPFVDSETWLRHPSPEIYTLPASQYPKTVSLIQLWIALALERWDDSLINLPWLLCAGALGLAFYGQLRCAGLKALMSLIGVYLLLSIPLLNTHTALAGYADLWLATVYALAGMAFLQWLRTGDLRQGGLALLFALACPLMKREGLAWMVTFLPPLLVAYLSFKKILLAAAVGLIGLAVWYMAGGFQLGGLWLTPEVIQVPFIGRFELELHAVWEPFYRNLFLLGSWNLLWYFVIAVFLFSAIRIVTHRQLLIDTAFIGSGLALILFTFFFTSNAAWVENYTIINRILLQWVPTLLFYIFLLLDFRATPSVELHGTKSGG